MNDLTEEELARVSGNVTWLLGEHDSSFRQSLLANLTADYLPRLLAEVRRHREYMAKLKKAVRELTDT